MNRSRTYLLAVFGVILGTVGPAQANGPISIYEFDSPLAPGKGYDFHLLPLVDSDPVSGGYQYKEAPLVYGKVQATLDTDSMTVVADHIDVVWQENYSDQIPLPGFGNNKTYSIEYTATVSADSMVEQSIDPVTLAFTLENSFFSTVYVSGQIDVEGSVSVFGFDKTFTWPEDNPSYFDDTNYPDSIDMILSGMHKHVPGSVKIFEEHMDGHLVEFYLDAAQLQIGPQTLTGYPIPEPATLGLLTTGGIALLRRRRPSRIDGKSYCMMIFL